MVTRVGIGFQTGSGMGIKFEINGSGNGGGNNLMGMDGNGGINCWGIPADLYCPGKEANVRTALLVVVVNSF